VKKREKINGGQFTLVIYQKMFKHILEILLELKKWGKRRRESTAYEYRIAAERRNTF
jgi:hypothetical protein